MEAAFASRMLGGSWVFSDTLSSEEVADIQGLIAANGLSTAGGGLDDKPSFEYTVAATVSNEEAAFANMAAAHPNTTIIRGPAFGEMPTSVVPCGWVFSQTLPPDRLAEIQGLVAMNGLSGSALTGVPTAEENSSNAEAVAAQASAADAAFSRMLAEHPGATELAPGVYCCPRE